MTTTHLLRRSECGDSIHTTRNPDRIMTYCGLDLMHDGPYKAAAHSDPHLADCPQCLTLHGDGIFTVPRQTGDGPVIFR